MIKIPIDIKNFECADNPDTTRVLAKRVFELLKNNKDKAYSTLDIQTEFKISYGKVSEIIRRLKRLYDKNLQYKWIRLSGNNRICLLYTSPSPRDRQRSRMPSSA